MFHSQPVAWVLGETLEAARQGAARVIAEYEAAAADADHRRRHRGVEFSLRAGAHDARRSLGDRDAARCRFQANSRSAGRNIFISKRNVRFPGSTKAAA